MVQPCYFDISNRGCRPHITATTSRRPDRVQQLTAALAKVRNCKTWQSDSVAKSSPPNMPVSLPPRGLRFHFGEACAVSDVFRERGTTRASFGRVTLLLVARRTDERLTRRRVRLTMARSARRRFRPLPVEGRAACAPCAAWQARPSFCCRPTARRRPIRGAVADSRNRRVPDRERTP
jgi:hypothetical protein